MPPLYDFVCLKCEKKEEVMMRMVEYKRPICCEQEMQRIFSHGVVPDLEPYLDEHIGSQPTWVESKKHRQKLMKENGVYESFGKNWR